MIPDSLTEKRQDAWDALAPPICPICHKETFRLLSTSWGEMVCPHCLDDPICPHVRQSRHADILIAQGIRVCRLCSRLDSA